MLYIKLSSHIASVWCFLQNKDTFLKKISPVSALPTIPACTRQPGIARFKAVFLCFKKLNSRLAVFEHKHSISISHNTWPGVNVNRKGGNGNLVL